jgi:hypothetical protein
MATFENKPTSSKHVIIGPLTISEYKNESSKKAAVAEDPEHLLCLLCDDKFETDGVDNKDYLAHLLIMHKLVIADVKLIGDFKRLNGDIQTFFDRPIDMAHFETTLY